MDDIRKEFERLIKLYNSDPEGAHYDEDELYIKIIRMIAAGECEDPKGLCEMVLPLIDGRHESPEWPFPRWYS